MVSAASVSFASQGLFFTYLTRFVEYIQIYVNPLLFAPFPKRQNNFL